MVIKSYQEKKQMLSNEQNIALEEIKDFIEFSNKPIFILKGYAGTGKTTLIKFLCEYLQENEIDFLLTAPTGRAARILSSKTNLQAKTIHSTIYSPDLSLFENDFVDEKLLFTTKPNNDMENTVMIIDESSMITDQIDNDSNLLFGSGSLLDDIFNFLNITSSLRNKIIFVGDPAQLPPVKDELSPALDKEYLKKEYNIDSSETILKEIIRQNKESNILNNSILLRQSLEQEAYDNFEITESEEIKHLNSFNDLEFSEINKDRIIITFTNKRALYYNENYRKNVLHFNPDKLNENERLLVIHNNKKYKLFNGDFIVIKELLNDSLEEHKIVLFGSEEYNFTFIDAKINYENETGKLVDVKAKLLLNNLFDENNGLNFKQQNALKVLTERIEKIKRPSRKHVINYEELFIEYLEKLSVSPHLNALQVKFGYAVTCHKSQGGEWKDVIIDFNDFPSYQNKFFYRWAYTAITRASERLFLINPPKIKSNYLENNSDHYQLPEFQYEEISQDIKMKNLNVPFKNNSDFSF